MHQIVAFLAAFAYAAGGIVCHQLPERSFFWGDWQFPVCARCTGLYLSAALGSTAWYAIRWRRGPIPLDRRRLIAILAIAAVPTLASLVSGMAGWWDAGNIVRAAIGVPLGATMGVIVAAVLSKDLR